mmetsp:Transcript_38807/g.47282  ORF Transcript_38807/g.47282 Transcript_38807/m.47282 type:complete len:654 (-) Transcript_38807:200-2161(-)|eukprot:CAMPEP_0172498336 /NCGR_PEP_ID=MMETSP1066-20121228/112528_1 /TAXON_ID=671091 /ORGANISM="Coscinodiscus wailesii, Strain CCMP2513" /LENGTH=653 /DNA_ID=CAMNT_0013271575 /DNA_START=144 /DNA_END=2105 /DNA_ORIENTATION=-
MSPHPLPRIALALAALIAVPASAFYVPGVKPETFMRNAEVTMKVNAMTSIHTQLPKDYYRLPFCEPAGGPKMASENLGEFLTGNKIQSSPYALNMLLEKYCQILCQKTLNKADARNLKMHIKYGYHNNWIIDNLPSASVGLTESGMKQKHYAGGFPIGYMDRQTGFAYVYNHVNIIVDYHQVDPEEEGYRVVAFSVEPFSVNHKYSNDYEWDGTSSEGFVKPLETCPGAGIHMSRNYVIHAQIVEDDATVLYTYDVTWVPSDVRWASRWDVYLSEDHMVPAQVHWYSITNSILVVVFLSCLVLSVLIRNLRRDIASYNAAAILTDEEKEEDMDESGWKLVHADVFRPPSSYPLFFCVYAGSGTQLGITAFCAILCSAVGFLSPARRGSLMTSLLVFYVLFGVFAGYVSSRLYKTFKGRQWQLCTLFTATIFPGTLFFLFLFFNIVLFFRHSSASVPFIDVLIIVAMWACISVPLVFLGAYFGYKQDVIAFPTVTSTIARAIPPPSPLLHPKLGMAAAGMVPFAAAYVELFFIMTSLWMDQYYYVFGFTLIVYMILLVTCAEITILLVYYQLCAENHRWWWFSFFCSGSTAFYLFLYSCFWFQQLEASKMIITYLLYFGYMFYISFAMFLITGTVGAMSAFWFVRMIFGSIKVD